MEAKHARLIHAKFLGRVERLLGRGCGVNPFPNGSPQWEAFREGWSRALDDPISLDAGLSSNERRVPKGKESACT